ncbi:MAG: DNA-protecting protein DprA [Firmicutes bacterium]|jgi:DNA processing protein|nr:DNA-protecting protein DprA [Bacillota bacterium]
MSELQERELWLAVSQVPKIGPRSFYQLLDTFGSMKQFWTVPADEVRSLMAPLGNQRLEALLRARQQFDPEKTTAALAKAGTKIVTLLDDNYPANLKTIFDPPPVLYYRGEFQATDELAVAIVGARRATFYGREIASRFARELAQAGITVVSGLARGIDSAAHRGAVAGKGRTLAVLGCGLNVIYPPENARLYDEIASQGAVLTEFPLSTRPDARNFPRRNRIISGLARAVLVVEAAATSGSLITADFALEQGREVFAVPGPITSSLSIGTNNLIRQGARLVQKVTDIIEELGWTIKTTAETSPPIPVLELTANEKQVYACFSEGTGSIHIDELVRQSGLTAQEVTAILMMLELKGLVRQLPGKMFFRLPTNL